MSSLLDIYSSGQNVNIDIEHIELKITMHVCSLNKTCVMNIADP